MTNYIPGMIVRQRAIDWWPYLGTIINRVNKAAEEKNIEVLHEIFLDTAVAVQKTRKVTTVAGLEQDLKEKLHRHKKAVRELAARKRVIKTGIGIRGKPLKEITLKTYRNEIAWYVTRKNKAKAEVRQLAKTIKKFSCARGKLVVRGDVPFRVIFGGKHPAKLDVKFQQGWSKIR